jgi:hypothetical protein
MNLTVGQKLWYVPSERRDKPFEVTVENVGRKWAKIGYRLRVDKETLWADGGEYSSPGRCYLSEEDYLRELDFNATWTRFRMKVGNMYYPPSGIDKSAIITARRVLRLEE